MSRTPFAQLSALALTIGLGATPAVACHPSLPVIRSDKGRVFTAEAFAHPTWRQRGSDGRMRTYGRQVWRGRIGDRGAYLTFDEIPGTSGPNHHLAYRLDRPPVSLRWQPAGRWDLGESFIVRGGPLDGVWSVANCAS
ncbi:hypothetical protein [Phreatobacter cathodiphilus]|uniref:Uncharacterized protein n=1 Tax=Phreatobacter cathodiphilus TaxID=1868589 RepID=A0A2S0NA65_9HYPH|nr:hypothetical protein [Phreatobacter cathodiphilus]AVO44821.1 hypothetical protein C6569_06965 [Phreatobacter cathodiphilus]